MRASFVDVLTALMRGASHTVVVARAVASKLFAHTELQCSPARPHTQPDFGDPVQISDPIGVATPNDGHSAHAVMPATVSDPPYVPIGHVDFGLHAVASDACPERGPYVCNGQTVQPPLLPQ